MASNLRVAVASALLRQICRGEYNKFQRNLADPFDAQERMLSRIVRDLSRTDYGKSLRVSGSDEYERFAGRVPIHRYEDLQDLIDRQLLIREPVITSGRIVHVEPTSGSSGAVKRIPYTRSLLSSFTNMFCIWAYDLLLYGFEPVTGRIFLSVSSPNANSDGGFASDREYLSEPMRTLLSPFLVLPPTGVDDSQFRFRLAQTLLLDEDLEVVSIWSPSYFLEILAFIEAHRHELSPFVSGARRSLLSGRSSIDWRLMWPSLKVISCWDSAMAAALAGQLSRLFPNVLVQGKGLLATEAPITVPLIKAGGCLPLVSEVFLEFESTDGSIRRLHELQDGMQYKVIISQTAGLVRYQMNDLVAVHGFYRSTPRLKFLGRAEHTCDMVGEKLNEVFVRKALARLIPSGRYVVVPVLGRAAALEPAFGLGPQSSGRFGSQAGYVLLTEESAEIAAAADAALCQAFHYGQARRFGQLAPLSAVQVDNVLSLLQGFYIHEGQRVGNAKDVALFTNLDKSARLMRFLNYRLNAAPTMRV